MSSSSICRLKQLFYFFKGPPSGLRQFLAKMMPFTNDEKFFLLHVKRSFRLLISLLMTSQTGQQIITTRILSNISRSLDNQAKKLVQLIKYDRAWELLFSKNHVENEVGRLDPDFFLFY